MHYFERKTVLNKPCRKRTCDFLITRRSNASLDGFLSTVFLNEWNGLFFSFFVHQGDVECCCFCIFFFLFCTLFLSAESAMVFVQMRAKRFCCLYTAFFIKSYSESSIFAFAVCMQEKERKTNVLHQPHHMLIFLWVTESHSGDIILHIPAFSNFEGVCCAQLFLSPPLIYSLSIEKTETRC